MKNCNEFNKDRNENKNKDKGVRYERNGGLEKRRRNSSLSFYPLGPNSFLVGQPVGHRLPVTSRLLYVSWPRMFVKKHGRHQS